MKVIQEAVGYNIPLNEILDNYTTFKAGDPSQFAVIKVGGAALNGYAETMQVAQSLQALAQVGLYPCVVHGGGPQIDAKLDAHGAKHAKSDGIRVSAPGTVILVEQALNEVGKGLTDAINATGEQAVHIPSAINGPWAYAGDSSALAVNPSMISKVIHQGSTPIVGCIGKTPHDAEVGKSPINLNADIVAGLIAAKLGVKKYISLTMCGAIFDTKGVAISNLGVDLALAMIDAGEINGGMVPKVQEAIALLKAGIGTVAITSPKHLLSELFTNKGSGTLIHA